MSARVAGGWLTVPYTGHDLSQVELGLARRGEVVTWQHAYLDHHGGERVAKVHVTDELRRASAGLVYQVWLRVDGDERRVGQLVL